jgi:hypothetical protein
MTLTEQRSNIGKKTISKKKRGHGMVTMWSQKIKKPLELPLSG